MYIYGAYQPPNTGLFCVHAQIAEEVHAKNFMIPTPVYKIMFCWVHDSYTTEARPRWRSCSREWAELEWRAHSRLPAASEAGARHLNCLHMMSREACRPGPDVATRRAVASQCIRRPPNHLTFSSILSFREAAAVGSRR